MIVTSQVVVNERKHDLSILIHKNLLSVITISFPRGIERLPALTQKWWVVANMD